MAASAPLSQQCCADALAVMLIETAKRAGPGPFDRLGRLAVNGLPLPFERVSFTPLLSKRPQNETV